MLHDEAQAEVTAQEVYEAAEDRALRTTRALILAEAQVLHWKRLYVEAVNRAESLEAEVVDLGGRTTTEPENDPDPDAGCWHTGPSSPCDWNVCRQKGEDDGQSDLDGSTTAVGQAD
jgi:hypothetical protein